MKKVCARLGIVVVSALTPITVRSQEAKGLQAGPITISPLAGVAAVYDSNIARASSDEESDVYFQGSLGLKLGARAERFKAELLGFAGHRAYVDNNDLDFSTVGEFLNMTFGTPNYRTLALQQSYRRVEDTDEYRSTADAARLAPEAFLDADVRSRRDVIEAGAAVDAVLTDKIDARASYRFNLTDYDSENLFDLTGQGVQLAAAYRVTDNSAATLTLLGSLQESDQVDGSAKYAAARLGGRMRGTDRVMLQAGAGVQHLERPEDGETEEGFHYDVIATWAATDKMTVQIEGRNGLQLSSVFRANVVDFAAVRAGVGYRMTPSITLSASAVYRIDDYKDPVQNGEGQLVDRKDKGTALYLRVDNRMPLKPIRLFAQANYETMDSTARDYDVSGASLGAMIQY